jgi:hypothetical protein
VNELLKQFVKTYGPVIANLIIGGLLAAIDAIFFVLTNGQPNPGLLATLNVGVAAFLSYLDSHGRQLVTKEVKADADKKVASVLYPANSNFDVPDAPKE